MKIKLRLIGGAWIPHDKSAIEWNKTYNDGDTATLYWEDPTKRSQVANSLYHLWVNEIHIETGYTKEELYREFKKRFLKPIFERDDPEYRAMVESIRQVHRGGMEAEARTMIDFIVDQTSTTKCNVKHFTEYLNNIDMDTTTNRGFNLTRPADKWLENGIHKYRDLT